MILDKFCKNKGVPPEVIEHIGLHTKKYGKAKLILEHNKYKIEAESDIMREIESIPLVKEAHEQAMEKEAQF